MTRRFRSAGMAACCVYLALLNAAPLRADWRQWEAARVRLHARKTAFAAEVLPDSPERDEILSAERRAMLDALAALNGNRPPPVRTGWREEAYICPSDDSAQPFIRFLPATSRPDDATPWPLLVYLHGYSPDLNLLNWALLPSELPRIAESLGFAIAMPFGRSNTDFQMIGEQDVLRVIDEMQARFHTDPNRVILCGYSMGGMGVWCIGARFAERFAALLMIAARGDHYVWHRIEPDQVPAWRRKWIDDAFPRTRIDRLNRIPILAFHGEQDSLIPLREARFVHEHVRTVNPQARLEILPGADHWIADDVFARNSTRQWIADILARPPWADRPPPLSIRPGQTPSRIQNAFLDPFAFVSPSRDLSGTADARLHRRAREWERFAKARPRRRNESDLTPAEMKTLNLFVFGEPEESPLVRAALEAVGAEWTPAQIHLGGRSFPRPAHGFWLSLPNPHAPQRTLVIQSGIAWGPYLSDNHRYDLLPDVLVYRNRPLSYVSNEPEILAGGYVDDRSGIRWHDAPSEPHHE